MSHKCSRSKLTNRTYGKLFFWVSALFAFLENKNQRKHLLEIDLFLTFWHFLTEDWSFLYSEMPAKITDEEKLPKIPNLDVAQWKFYIKMNPNCEETQKKLKDEIKEKEMAPFYAQMCDELGQKPGIALEFHEFYLKFLQNNNHQGRFGPLIPEH